MLLCKQLQPVELLDWAVVLFHLHTTQRVGWSLHTKGWPEPGVMELSVTSVLAGFSEPGGWSGGDLGIPFFFQLSASATMQTSLFWCFLLGNRTY